MREVTRFCSRRPVRHRFLAALAVALVVLIGCRPRGERVVTAPTPTPGASATVESTINPAEPTPTPSHFELVVWAPVALSPQSREGGADLLTRQVEAFEAANPTISIRYEPKAQRGTSSLLQFLRTTSTVAPRVLPDLVVLPSGDFNDAARAGLLYPLDSLVADNLVQALYPFARRDGRFGDSLLALPLVVTVEHLVYRPQGARRPPTTWEEFLGGQQRLLFAAGGRSDGVNDPFLLQLLNVRDEPFLGGEVPDMEALERVLELYQAGRSHGLIPAEVTTLSESEDLWSRFLTGEAELLETDARTFLIEQSRVTGLAYAPVPTNNGLPTTVAEGHLVAITTVDPARQRAAAAYIAWLLAPEQVGPYASTTRWFPTRPDALESAIADAGYREFANSLLTRAWLRPSGSQWTAVSRAMQEQVVAVLNDQRTPAEAVQVLQESLRP
ncbi:MAG: extracellular solute-binding protein [Ardenticatenaceae bacterium]|nr:extracellular solute-binding protein [Ardenticatenaceae bacterium]